MKKLRSFISLLGLACLVLPATSCIISDSITTMTIAPDGSAQLIQFRSNIRSTEEDPAKNRKEVETFKDNFSARRGDPFDHLGKCGAEIVDVRWVRAEHPFSTLVVAKLPDAEAIGKYGTIGDDPRHLRIQTSLTADGSRRRLEIRWMPGSEDRRPDAPTKSADELRRNMADMVSEFRIVVQDGTIVSSAGFTVAGDKASALMENREIDRLLRKGGDATLHLEWTVE